MKGRPIKFLVNLAQSSFESPSFVVLKEEGAVSLIRKTSPAFASEVFICSFSILSLKSHRKSELFVTWKFYRGSFKIIDFWRRGMGLLDNFNLKEFSLMP